MAPKRLAVCVLASAALAASGCGSSKSSSNDNSVSGTTASANRLTRSELIAKGDAICARVNQRVFSNPARTTADLVRLTPRLSEYELAAAREMEKLNPPTSLLSDWQQIVAASKTLAEHTGELGEQVAKKNTVAARATLSTDATLQSELFAIAKRDGFKVCSRPG
jgi:hypothetical protein